VPLVLELPLLELTPELEPPPLELPELALPPLDPDELDPFEPLDPLPLPPEPEPLFDGEPPELLPFETPPDPAFTPPELEVAKPELDPAPPPPPSFGVSSPADVPGLELHARTALPLPTRTKEERRKEWIIGEDRRQRDASTVPSCPPRRVGP